MSVISKSFSLSPSPRKKSMQYNTRRKSTTDKKNEMATDIYNFNFMLSDQEIAEDLEIIKKALENVTESENQNAGKLVKALPLTPEASSISPSLRKNSAQYKARRKSTTEKKNEMVSVYNFDFMLSEQEIAEDLEIIKLALENV